MPSNEIVIEIPPIEVERLGAVAMRFVDAFGRLWSSGRLKHLMESAEGRETVALFDGMMREDASRWVAARAAGQEFVVFRHSLPSNRARMAVAVFRRVVALIGDRETMQAVGGSPLTGPDLGLLEEILRHADGELALHAVPDA